MIAFIIDWLLLILAVGFLVPAFAYNECRSYAKSAFFMLISFAAVCWYFFPDLKTFVEAHGIVKSVVVFILSYVAMAVVTAFLFWISYNIRAKEKYQEIYDRISKQYDMLTGHIRTLCIKKEIISSYDDLRVIFDDRDRTLKYESTCDRMYKHQDMILNCTEDELAVISSRYEQEIAKVLPPTYKTCKPFILGAAYSWPITLIWLLLSRVVKQLINLIMSLFGGVFNKVAKFSFGRF
jgi:hypothetical protein